MKTILVTGGAGFIGSNLCRRLLNDGNKVICIDNLQTGSENNIKDFLKNPNFTFLYLDISDPNIVLDDYQASEIYNLACPASPPKYQQNPIHTTMTNVIGMITMLKYSSQWAAKILQASTSEIYGDPIEHPQKESYLGNVNPIGVRACYDEGKRLAETLCFDYLRVYRTNVKVVRIFNTYGPGMNKDDGRVVSTLIHQALTDQDLTLFGDGYQTRSLCYIDDLIDGLIAMMDSNENGPINLGNPEEISIVKLASKIAMLCNKTPEIKFTDLPKDDPKQRCPDITLAKEKLNWEPKTSIIEGLKSTILYEMTKKD